MKNSKASNKSTLRLVLALALLSTSVDMTLSSVWGMDENGLDRKGEKNQKRPLVSTKNSGKLQKNIIQN
jgi:hypothetical protein